MTRQGRNNAIRVMRNGNNQGATPSKEARENSAYEVSGQHEKVFWVRLYAARTGPMPDPYLRYMQSTRWASKRDTAIALQKQCFTCYSAQSLDILPLTYDQMYKETMAHIIVLCSDCRAEVSAGQSTGIHIGEVIKHLVSKGNKRSINRNRRR